MSSKLSRDTEQPSVYAIHSVDNQNSDAKTTQSVMDEQLPSDLEKSASANDVQQSADNTVDSTD